MATNKWNMKLDPMGVPSTIVFNGVDISDMVASVEVWASRSEGTIVTVEYVRNEVEIEAETVQGWGVCPECQELTCDVDCSNPLGQGQEKS